MRTPCQPAALVFGVQSGSRICLALWGLLACLGQGTAQTDTLGVRRPVAVPLVEIAAPAARFTAFERSADTWGNFATARSTVAEALQLLPGALLRGYGGQGGVQTVSLRGFGSAHTTLSINGVPYTAPVTGSVDFGPFSLAQFTRLELHYGGGLLSQNSLAGTVNLNVTPLAPRWRTSLGAGRFGEWRGNLTHSPRRDSAAAAQWRWDIGAMRSREDYPVALNGETARRANNNYAQLNAQVWGVHQLCNRHALEAYAWGFAKQLNVPGPVVQGNLTPGTERLRQAAGFAYLRHRWANLRQRGSLTSTLRHQADVLAHAYAGEDAPYIFQDTWAEARQDVRLSQNWSLAAALQTAATHLRSLNLNAGSRARRQEVNLGAVAEGYLYQNRRAALALQALFRLNGVPGVGALPNGGTQLQLRLGKNRNHGFRAKAGYSHRLPSFAELYYFNLGNPAIAPEKALTVEVSAYTALAGQWAAVRLQAGSFFNQTRDKILAVPVTPVRWQVQTLGLAQTVGGFADLTTNFLFGVGALVLTTSATYQPTRDFSITDGARLPYTPDWLLTAGLALKLQRGSRPNAGAYELGSSVAWGGARYASLQNDRFSFLPPYAYFDVYLRGAWGVRNSRLQLEVTAENLGQNLEPYVRGYPIAANRLRGTISYFID